MKNKIARILFGIVLPLMLAGLLLTGCGADREYITENYDVGEESEEETVPVPDELVEQPVENEKTQTEQVEDLIFTPLPS